MGLANGKKFSQKHQSDAKPDRSIKDEILKQAKNRNIPCAVAFEIVKNLQVSPEAVGKNVDLLDFKLVKCQLGLFGYQPKKKIAKPQKTIDESLKDAITDALVRERLSCKSAWEIASRLNVPKMTVSNVCEAMGIKIKDCQLGAF
jgi:hypothetical protein